jgi:hypothetical protein
MTPSKRYRPAKAVSRASAWVVATLEPDSVDFIYGIVVRNLAAPPTDYAVTSSILTDTANFYDANTKSDAKDWRTEVIAVRHESNKCVTPLKSKGGRKDLLIKLSKVEIRHEFDTEWRHEPCSEIFEF